MKYKTKIVVVLLLCFLGCSDNETKFYIGYDPSWFPKNFEELQNNVNGYVQEVLLEVSGKKNVTFILVKENFDSLFQEVEKERVDAVLSFKTPYSFLKDKYNFSDPMLNIGHVLVVRKENDYDSLNDMKKKLVGIIREEDSSLLLEKYEDIFIKIYDSIPTLLDDVANGFLDGAVIYRLKAANFVNNIYYKDLKITKELTDEAIRFVSLKENKSVIDNFNEGIKELEKEGDLLKIKKKWNLY